MIISRIALWYPAISFILLIFFTMLPFRLLHMSNMTIMISSIAVFYWTLYRPKSLPYWILFLLGCMYDIIAGLPMGLHALTNVVIRSSVLFARGKYTKAPFSAVWLKYVVFSAMIALLHWMLMSLFYGHVFHIGVVITQWFLSVLSYPLFHHVFNKINQRMPKELVERKIL